ncbi:MAG: histidinol-phosphate transaminase [Phenylobacterium sp.]
MTDRPVPKPGILQISPYTPGAAAVAGVAHSLKLSANENVLGASSDAKAAFASAVDELHLYPDGRCTALREAISARYGLEPERLVFGCGSDEIFHLLGQVYLQPGDNAVQGEHGFGAFAIATRAAGGEVRMAREVNLRIDVDELLACVDEHTRIVWVANPANPTGTVVGGSEIRRLHAALPPQVVLVLDGAYAEFAEDTDFEDGTDLVRSHPNVIMTRTFSKLHGLAALRVGWAYVPADMADAIERIRPPFNVSIASQRAAVAALSDEDFQARSLELVRTWRPWLAQQLGGLGLETTRSSANFVLARFPKTPGRTAADADAFLCARGLIPRMVGGYGLPDHLRITIGLEEHNRALVEALSEFMGARA